MLSSRIILNEDLFRCPRNHARLHRLLSEADVRINHLPNSVQVSVGGWNQSRALGAREGVDSCQHGIVAIFRVVGTHVGSHELKIVA